MSGECFGCGCQGGECWCGFDPRCMDCGEIVGFCEHTSPHQFPDRSSKLAPLFSSGKDDWETPDDLFKRYDDIFHFVLDAAADGTNHKVPVWFGPDSPVGVLDALTADWGPYLLQGNVWLNPPYSRGLQAKFVEKAALEVSLTGFAHNVVCLLPARTDTKLFHGVIKTWGKVEFLKGRLKFKGAKSSAPFPSMVVIF